VKRPLKPDELRLWSLVAATVHPLPGRATLAPPKPDGEGKGAQAERLAPSTRSPAAARPPAPARRETPHPIEPRRKQRLARERDPIAARIDLHGMNQDQARAVLERFLLRAWEDGYRAALVITGKGVQGDGVLRRRTPEWLAAAHLAPVVAGVAEAHRRHGGEGALYVALKRRPRI
jgi:DNA-nicking Smr family endonuclease